MSASRLQIRPTIQHDLTNTASFNITIRFSLSLPDLPLSIASNSHSTVATIKQLIRASLPIELQARRIRLIYAGKALTDDARLNHVLKPAVSQPPSRVATPSLPDGTENARGSGKGKEVIRDPPIQTRIYVHCSIGDVVLTVSELEAETALANRQPDPNEATDTSREDVYGQQDNTDNATTLPAPRGFDRLLTAGFSASEVQSLRLQFMDIQAHIHTPDTMPSPNTLRDMEDRWLDNGEGGAGTGSLGGGAGLADDDTQAGALDDMLWGATTGFFWPVGCLFWGGRESGIWSQRRKMAVVIGVALNVGIGLIRYTS